MPIVNLKLEQNGFRTFGEFVNAWIEGKYPTYEKDEQVEKLLVRIREKGIIHFESNFLNYYYQFNLPYGESEEINTDMASIIIK